MAQEENDVAIPRFHERKQVVLEEIGGRVAFLVRTVNGKCVAELDESHPAFRPLAVELPLEVLLRPAPPVGKVVLDAMAAHGVDEGSELSPGIGHFDHLASDFPSLGLATLPAGQPGQS
jgi:hypothetical protein